MVVYHQTNSKIHRNIKTGEVWEELSWSDREKWQERNDWDKYWKEEDFFEFSNRRAHRSIEMPAFFFATEYDQYHEYGERTIKAFLNLRNPAKNPHILNAGVTNDAGEVAMNTLINEGYDGFIREEDGVIYEANAFYPNQIKSATDNVGSYNL